MPLPHKHLMTLSLEVNASEAYTVGQTNYGRRVIAPITGGTFAGDSLNGTIQATGYDWVNFRADGIMDIDVRLVLLTHDEALIYLQYQGRLIANSDAHKRIANGEEVDPNDYSMTTSAKFECGIKKYHWLNNVIAVGIGHQKGYQPEYQIYKIGK